MNTLLFASGIVTGILLSFLALISVQKNQKIRSVFTGESLSKGTVPSGEIFGAEGGDKIEELVPSSKVFERAGQRFGLELSQSLEEEEDEYAV